MGYNCLIYNPVIGGLQLCHLQSSNLWVAIIYSIWGLQLSHYNSIICGLQLSQYNTIQYTLFNEGEHINLLQFSNKWPSKINSNRQGKKMYYKIANNLS